MTTTVYTGRHYGLQHSVLGVRGRTVIVRRDWCEPVEVSVSDTDLTTAQLDTLAARATAARAGAQGTLSSLDAGIFRPASRSTGTHSHG